MVGILQQSTHDIDGALYGPWMLSLGRRTQKVKLRLFSLEQGAYLVRKMGKESVGPKLGNQLLGLRRK